MKLFTKWAPKYWAKGLPVIPLEPLSKGTHEAGWTKFGLEMPSEEQQAAWLRLDHGNNIGLPLGPASGVIVVDVDSYDPEIVATIEAALPVSPWRRVGQKGYAAAYRFDGQKTQRVDGSSGERLMEVLSTGTQIVMPPSIHPITKEAYTATAFLGDVKDQLPALPEDWLDSVVAALGAKDIYIKRREPGARVSMTSWISAGSRDNSMIQVVGSLARGVMRGESSILRAIQDLEGWAQSRVENVAGDPLDVRKGVERLAQFILRDVTEKELPLPLGWDEGMSDQLKTEMGFDIITVDQQEWDLEELKTDHTLRISSAMNDSEKIMAIEKTIERIAYSKNINPIRQDALLKWISDTNDTSLGVSALKRNLKSRMQGNVEGLNHAEIANELMAYLSETGDCIYALGSFWQWKGSNFEKMEMGYIMKIIGEEYGHLPAAKKHNDHKGIYGVLSSKIEGTLDLASGNGINFANGFLTHEGQLVDHNQQYGMTYTLPYRYLPELANQCPEWLHFLKVCWGDEPDFEERLACIQEMICVTLLGMATKFQKAFLLYGVGGSGKSQVLRIVEGLLPTGSVSNVPPDKWTDKFEKTLMADKLMNKAGELSDKRLIDGAKFKSMIEGEEDNGHYKSQQLFKFRPVCAHWFASNFLPKSTDTSRGFTRRWLILSFNNIFGGKVILDYGDKILMQEREAIVAWALEAMPRLMANEKYTVPMCSDRMVERMAQTNDVIRAFMISSGHIEIDPSKQEEVNVDQMFTTFWRYSMSVGQSRVPSNGEFRERLNLLSTELGYDCVYDERNGARTLTKLRGCKVVNKL